jgi:hypothetical protein
MHRRDGNQSSEHPGSRIANRLALVQGKHALDVAHQRPNEPPDENDEPNQEVSKKNSDCQVENANPERANLELIVRS